MEEVTKDFQQLQREFRGHPFLQKYSALFSSLQSCKANEERVTLEIDELSKRAESSTSKYQKSIVLKQEDDGHLVYIAEEIAKMKKHVDSTGEKVSQSNEVISTLKREISSLSELAQQGSTIIIDDGEQLETLKKQRAEYVTLRDSLADKLTILRAEISELVAEARVLEKDKIEGERKRRALGDVISQCATDANRESLKRQNLEAELQKQKKEIEVREKIISEKETEIDTVKKDIAELKSNILEAKRNKERTETEVSRLEARLDKLKQDLNDQTSASSQSASTNTELAAQVSQKHAELSKNREELQKTKRKLAQYMTRVEQLKREQAELVEQKDRLRDEVTKLNGELDTQQRSAESDRRVVDRLRQEKSVIMRKMREAAGSAKDVQDALDVASMEGKNLEQEMMQFKDESQKERKAIFHIQKERQQLSTASVKSNQQYLQMVQNVKIRDVTIADLQKKVTESEAKLKQQQQLYEAVRADRNIYSKNLIQSQDEITEMKRKFKIMSHSIDQLREEIETKDGLLLRESAEKRKIEREKEKHKTELDGLSSDIEAAESIIAKQRADISKLNAIIAEADSERERQQKDLQVMMNERDQLDSQLIVRNKELEELYEKIRIQQAALKRGEKEYSRRVRELAEKKTYLHMLEEELVTLQKATRDMGVFKKESIKLQADLITEKARTKALSDELENPMNVHRWRRLEGSDPASYEMIQKIQQLQKKLIAKTEEVAEKDLLIDEKEKLYLELKKILARQPGPEIVEQVDSYQRIVREKAKQVQSVEDEMMMFRSQVEDYKADIDQLKKILARQPGPEIVEQVDSYQRIVREKAKQVQSVEDEMMMFRSQVEDYKADIDRLTDELHGLKDGYFASRRRERKILQLQQEHEEPQYDEYQEGEIP
ncbi:Cilia- and flagella-associated protein 58 [Aduncisulcus paluster]|uniref:Cilia- and flagella-associated protein 58 n=1 Tax=Aduncisulcus paluster TaxID=2918883 RepID=A0ABQ5K488_9EUKA|nr:Cilia- and flagella-associated protein 58 [Aduncisulcus paluster]